MKIETDIPRKFIHNRGGVDGIYVGCQYNEAEELVRELRRVADDIQANVLERKPELRAVGRRRAS